MATKAEVIDTGSNGRFVVEVDGTQKLRVDDDYVFINTNTVGSVYASNLVINDTSNCGITIRSGNGNGQYGSIYFADGTSGDARYAGKVEYNQYYDYSVRSLAHYPRYQQKILNQFQHLSCNEWSYQRP